jgi:(4-(4-[2-(gamma-L-glutamylamino)ethyl]phenoxymethyl)furan-2-yl)methanamine synthase
MTPAAAPASAPARRQVLGWDVGGAHLKACLLQDGAVVDVAQWACPLWQGQHHLTQALDEARARWPLALHAPQAVTMTGEMTDLFADREDGVQRISQALAKALPGPVHVYAGGPHTFVPASEAGERWADIASANWRATAHHVAASLGNGVLIDIGSTTTDLIALRDGTVPTPSRSDRDRLASGELVYHGVVRTPLCALAPQMPLQGKLLNVMNEWFATTADVYRLTGELDPAHDLYPAADNGAKDRPATQARLARMLGCDRRDASDAEWLRLAHDWRAAQVALLADNLHRVLAAARGAGSGVPTLVSAGCGDFLVPLLAQHALPGDTPSPVLRYRDAVARIAPGPQSERVAAWAQVCAPSVAVAALLDRALH